MPVLGVHRGSCSSPARKRGLRPFAAERQADGLAWDVDLGTDTPQSAVGHSRTHPWPTVPPQRHRTRPDTPLGSSSGQVVSLLRDVARYVVAFWREVAGSRAFALSSPALLRRAVGEVKTDGVAAAARLLLTARIVTNVNLSKELVQSLELLEKSS